MKSYLDCAGEIEQAVDSTVDMQKENAKNGNGSKNNNGASSEQKEEKKDEKVKEPKKPDQISIENAEEQDQGVNAAAAIGAENQLGGVVSPASVWLPYRDSNTDRNKVGHAWEYLIWLFSLKSTKKAKRIHLDLHK